MADIPAAAWSELAANNIQPSPDGWPSGSSPTIVYTTDREMMGAIKREWDRNNPTITSGGSANVQTLTYSVAPTAYVRGQRFCFISGFTNTGATTLNVNGLGAKAVQIATNALLGGELFTNGAVEVVYDGTQFQILAGSGYLPVIGGLATGPLIIKMIASSPTYGQLNMLANTVAIGNFLEAFVNTATTAGLRWSMAMGDGTAESGSNAGSNLAIYAYSDTGTLLSAPLSITRSTGAVTLGSAGVIGWGYRCRAGAGGTLAPNSFNINFGTGSQLWIDGSNTGTITVTSDYRTKRDIAPLPSMWERVKELKPISFRIKDFSIVKDDGKEHWGFVAHELQETLIEDAANGKKDEENVIQSPNWMVVVATLTKALQEAMARIEKLEARLPLAPETA